MFQEVVQVKQVNNRRYSTATIERSYMYFIWKNWQSYLYKKKVKL